MSPDDDYGERDLPAILEPENLVPLVVMAAVGGLFAVSLFAGWLNPF